MSLTRIEKSIVDALHEKCDSRCRPLSDEAAELGELSHAIALGIWYITGGDRSVDRADALRALAGAQVIVSKWLES